MTRLNKFVTAEELESVRTAQKVSGMFLTGGRPMGDPQGEVESLRRKYSMPDGTGLDPTNGEFVSYRHKMKLAVSPLNAAVAERSKRRCTKPWRRATGMGTDGQSPSRQHSEDCRFSSRIPV